MLSTFIPRVQVLEEEKTLMFKEWLYPRYINLVSTQIRRTFIEVVDVVMIGN